MKKIISYFLVFLISFFVFNFDVSANELDTNELNLLTSEVREIIKEYELSEVLDNKINFGGKKM